MTALEEHVSTQDAPVPADDSRRKKRRRRMTVFVLFLFVLLSATGSLAYRYFGEQYSIEHPTTIFNAISDILRQ